MRRSDDLREYAANHYLSKLQAGMGQRGVDLAKRLHPKLREIYRHIDYESISGSLTVAVTMDHGGGSLPDSPIQISDLGDLLNYSRGTLTIQFHFDGRILLWLHEVAVSAFGEAFVYTYQPTAGERFWTDGELAGESELRGYPLFGLPIFRTLTDALQQYSRHVARSSQCGVLEQAWREPGRVMWRSGPETLMRRSIYFYLRNTLADGTADVQEEAPADDSNPVDITVRWADSNRIGLIEVKWLGASGSMDPLRITTRWSQKRAVDALQQIVAYIDLTRSRAPAFDVRGYLVVFDGRRANVRAETTSCSRIDGLKFETADIEYSSELLQRHMVATPIRCFCEPNWVTASPSRRTRSK